MTRSGIVAIVGKPNAGKSTLLNRLVGEKLAITSPKPQSTRDRVVGILTRGDTQLVFTDTPGLLEPRYALHHAMRSASLGAIHDADVVLYLLDGAERLVVPLDVAARLESAPKAAVVVAINKSDVLDDHARHELRRLVPEAHFVSALTGEGLDALLAFIVQQVPESPFLYDADDISVQSLRYFAAEFVRESALEQLSEEVPYSVACVVEEFREDRSPVYIRAVLYVERASQKRILIGEGGTRIKAIGSAARGKIEALLGTSVYLDLWVKVLENWRRDVNALRRLGYKVPEDHKP